MKKFSTLLAELKGQYVAYEVYDFDSHGIRRASSLLCVYTDASGWISENTKNIALESLWAKDYELMDEEDYNSFHGDGSDTFADHYEPGDKVLIIMLSHLSSKMLYSPEVKTVREARTELLGQYSDYLVVKPAHSSGSSDDDCYYDDDYDGSDSDGRQEVKIVDKPRDVLDSMYVDTRRTELCTEEELKANYEFSNTTWWEAEEAAALDDDSDDSEIDENWAFERRYGSKDAKVLLMFLA
jgi:hypothetical protein